MVATSDTGPAPPHRGPAPEIGMALRARAADIAERIVHQWRETRAADPERDQAFVEDLRRLAAEGVLAIAQYLVTGDPASAIRAPHRSWVALGVVTLSRVTKLYLGFRQSCSEAVEAEAARLGSPRGVVDACLAIVDLAFDVSLSRMAQRYETTRGELERKLEEDRALLEHRALHDPLTGLANRALLLDRLDHAIGAARRRDGRPTVLFLDLDDFKGVNDASGHAVGDAVLAAVAERLHTVVRSSDTVARLGGDEFIVMCEDVGEPRSEGLVLAERVRRALQEPFDVGERPVHVSASIGVASAEPEESAESLLARADQAMYQAKQHGRDRVEAYHPAMDRQATRRAELASALHRAVAADQLRVAYQPVFSLPARAMVSREALLRWDHPRLGTVPPAEFVPVAEQNGLIGDVGNFVLRRACEDCAVWRASQDPGTGVAVNVSGRQLESAAFTQQVVAALGESGLPAGALTLEVTETVLMGRRGDARADLDRLGALGVRIGLDDFGIGASSLSWLARLPLHVVKVDRSFAAALGQSDRAKVIVEAMVNLSHTLGLDVVVKGVETETQLEWLAGVGCDAVQGYLLGHPEPAPAVPAGWPPGTAGRRRPPAAP
jgi:diguanylate cyclase (GGDEF)-like protein